MDRPQNLLEAEAAIARGLRDHLADASLLIARSQANLIETSYEVVLERLFVLEPEPVS
jgi:hypothetical protein